MIVIFLSVRHPVLRTHFLLNPKYCSGFIFQQYVDHNVNLAVLYNLAFGIKSQYSSVF